MKQKQNIKQRGQALVEFALALPLLLLLVFGVLEFGRAFKIKIVLTNAAREGTHYFMYDKADYLAGSFPKTTETVVTEALNSGIVLDPSRVTVFCFIDSNDNGVADSSETVPSAAGANCKGNGPDRSTVVARVTYDFIPVLLGWFGSLTIQGESRMLVP